MHFNIKVCLSNAVSGKMFFVSVYNTVSRKWKATIAIYEVILHADNLHGRFQCL